MPLTLSLAGLAVTLAKFSDTNYPRTLIQSSAVEFSINGTPALSGPAFSGKHLWSISAQIDIRQHQHQLIEALAYEFHERRRNLQDCDITIYDTTATVIEAARTRDIVPGTVEQSINNGSHVAYYAVFKAALTEGPKFSELGRYNIATLALTETVLVPKLVAP